MMNGPAQAITKKVDNQRGFTLVEVMVTIVVVTIAILSMLLAITAVQQMTEAAHEKTMAIQHAHQVIDRIRDFAEVRGINNVLANYPPGTVVGVQDYTDCAALPCIEQLNNERVIITYAYPNAKTLDVMVTVNWRERGIRPVSTLLRTWVTWRMN